MSPGLAGHGTSQRHRSAPYPSRGVLLLALPVDALEPFRCCEGGFSLSYEPLADSDEFLAGEATPMVATSVRDA